MTTTPTSIIESISEGKTYAMRTRDTYASVARRDGRYVVECGWTVEESFDDDPGVSTYWPFSGRWSDRAWIGRSTATDEPADAARIYDAYRNAVLGRSGSRLGGDKIGSVTR